MYSSSPTTPQSYPDMLGYTNVYGNTGLTSLTSGLAGMSKLLLHIRFIIDECECLFQIYSITDIAQPSGRRDSFSSGGQPLVGTPTYPPMNAYWMNMFNFGAQTPPTGSLGSSPNFFGI
jgi:hypothetical protein